MKVHLVDGTFELFRCFHGAPRATVAGREVGASRALLATLLSLIRKGGATHMAVAFDRGAIRPGGPAASPSQAAPGGQYDLALDLVRALGVTVWPMIRYQADDALASGAARFANEPGVEQVVLCTTDKDLTQCVRDTRVILLDRIRKATTDEAAVVRRFGVPPALMPDWFALVGDPSDGLPGVPGFGPASAAALLNRWEAVEAIPDDPADWDVAVRSRDRLAAALRERRREALLWRNLSVLRDDLPLPDTLADLEWTGARREAMDAVADRLGPDAVAGTLERIPLWR